MAGSWRCLKRRWCASCKRRWVAPVVSVGAHRPRRAASRSRAWVDVDLGVAPVDELAPSIQILLRHGRRGRGGHRQGSRRLGKADFRGGPEESARPIATRRAFCPLQAQPDAVALAFWLGVALASAVELDALQGRRLARSGPRASCPHAAWRGTSRRWPRRRWARRRLCFITRIRRDICSSSQKTMPVVAKMTPLPAEQQQAAADQGHRGQAPRPTKDSSPRVLRVCRPVAALPLVGALNLGDAERGGIPVAPAGVAGDLALGIGAPGGDVGLAGPVGDGDAQAISTSRARPRGSRVAAAR